MKKRIYTLCAFMLCGLSAFADDTALIRKQFIEYFTQQSVHKAAVTWNLEHIQSSGSLVGYCQRLCSDDHYHRRRYDRVDPGHHPPCGGGVNGFFEQILGSLLMCGFRLNHDTAISNQCCAKCSVDEMYVS